MGANECRQHVRLTRPASSAAGRKGPARGIFQIPSGRRGPSDENSASSCRPHQVRAPASSQRSVPGPRLANAPGAACPLAQHLHPRSSRAGRRDRAPRARSPVTRWRSRVPARAIAQLPVVADRLGDSRSISSTARPSQPAAQLERRRPPSIDPAAPARASARDSRAGPSVSGQGRRRRAARAGEQVVDASAPSPAPATRGRGPAEGSSPAGRRRYARSSAARRA